MVNSALLWYAQKYPHISFNNKTRHPPKQQTPSARLYIFFGLGLKGRWPPIDATWLQFSSGPRNQAFFSRSFVPCLSRALQVPFLILCHTEQSKKRVHAGKGFTREHPSPVSHPGYLKGTPPPLALKGAGPQGCHQLRAEAANDPNGRYIRRWVPEPGRWLYLAV